MKPILKTDIILSQLRKGGLVLSERGTGKTAALAHRALEIILSEGRVIVALCSEGMAQHFNECCDEFWPSGTARPLLAWKESQLVGRGMVGARAASVLVDEYFHNWFRSVGSGAVATAPFLVHFSSSIQDGLHDAV